MTLKGIGRGARQMVRFPGPFTKKGKKKRARANEQADAALNGYSSAEEVADFYSDIEEACQSHFSSCIAYEHLCATVQCLCQCNTV